MNRDKTRIAFHTLGCKLNFAETSTIAHSLDNDKFIRVDESDPADVYVINTCTVTEAADKKCRQVIKKFINRSPQATIIVTGCYAQLHSDELSRIKGVDLILGSKEKFNLEKYLSDRAKRIDPLICSCGRFPDTDFSPSHSSGDRTRSFLKVQDGCDYKCSYCTIPMARGRSRNPGIRSLVNEAESIASNGIREIVLTGVNTGDYGKSTGESFISLLKAIAGVKGIERIRLSSVEPNLITNELIELVSEEPKLLPHFHIPLQSGSDKILKLMRRRYRRELFARKAERIIRFMPLAGIGADVITGFPGETEEDFNDTYNFLRDLPLSYLHVFPFSERPGTPAASMDDKVPKYEKDSRVHRLLELAGELHNKFTDLNIGHTDHVLFEESKNGVSSTGFTGNYLRVIHPYDPALRGNIIKVLLTGKTPDGYMTSKIV